MNENHAKLMPSPEWAAYIHDEVLPKATAGVELGTDLSNSGRARGRPPIGYGTGSVGWSRSSRKKKPQRG